MPKHPDPLKGLIIPGEGFKPLYRSPGTVGVPYYRFLTSEFLDQIDRLELPKDSIVLRKPGFEPAEQRNWLVMNYQGEWLLQVDADQGFDQRSLLRLLDTGLDIVAGVYYQRGGDFRPSIFKGPEHKTDQGKWAYRAMFKEVLEYLREHKDEVTNAPHQLFKESCPVEVDAAATGFMLVRRKVFEALSYPWFSFHERGTEDLFFCRKAKEAGFKIYADLSVQVGHFTEMEVGFLHLLAKEGIIK